MGAEAADIQHGLRPEAGFSYGANPFDPVVADSETC